MQLDLSFQLVRCTCGETRPGRARCPSCGSTKPWGDAHLERRERIVAAVRPALLPDTREYDKPMLPEEGLSAAAKLTGPILSALATIDEGPEDRVADAMRRAIRPLTELKWRVATAKRRGNRMVWQAVDGILSELRAAVGYYLDAFVAPTPQEAEAIAAEAQRHIHAAGEIAGELSDDIRSLRSGDMDLTGPLLVGFLAGRWSGHRG